uniref:Protein TANC2 n=1 Tax=Phallusia mammillata TaxID=59560 RepID=A0A6F9DV02_9ASCI|nr:protein TANC2 [Phallusia mammillata]
MTSTYDTNSRAVQNRKPIYVQIPTVPGVDEEDPDSVAVDDGRASDLDEPDPSLMAKLGLLVGDQRVSHVKTTSHPHPVLDHAKIGATIQTAEGKKDKTTSPASTLSDKGIGSSVGSFDSELRNFPSAYLVSPYDASRSGSLDSRKQDIFDPSIDETPIPNHSRSSSDIICHSGAYSANVMQAKLAEQSSASLWNSDPRRGSASGGRTSSVRPRRPSTRKQRIPDDSSMERDASSEVTKLPQLCRDSPSHSTRSSVSSSRSITPAVSVCEVGSTGRQSLKPVKTNGFSNEPLPPPPPPPPVEDGDEDQSVQDLPPPPPPPIDNEEDFEKSLPPPPLPPKESSQFHDPQNMHSLSMRLQQHVDSEIQYNAPTRPPKTDLSLRLSASRAYSNPPTPCVEQRPQFDRMVSSQSYVEDSGRSANNTLTGRLRLSSDGNVGSHHNEATEETRGRLWVQDPRRESPVQPTQGRYPALTSSMSTTALGRAESMSRVPESRGRSMHGSSGAIWENSRPHAASAPQPPPLMDTGHDDRNSSPTVTYDEDTFSRHSNNRSSTRSNPGERRKISNTEQPKAVRFAPYRSPEVNLTPLNFELPLAVTSETKFIGREWVYGDILSSLSCGDSKMSKGVVVMGGSGQGKTTLINHLVSYSYHGLRNNKQNNSLKFGEDTIRSHLHRSSSPMSNARQLYVPSTGSHRSSTHSSRTSSPAFGSSVNSRAGSQTSLTEDSCRKVASQVVAFHFCQSDNNTTCYVPEFIHSIAAQLTQAPQLTAYRELLISEPHLQNLLSVRSCIQNPTQALMKAIIEPLIMLKRSQKLPRSNLVILIDALSDAEQYRPDYGYSIVGFLQRHLPDFPDFIKIVATCRTDDQELISSFPVHFMSLDGGEENLNVSRDAQLYISHRVAGASCLSNLTLSGKTDPAVVQKQLAQHLIRMAKGNFLYLRMTLDLMEQGDIVPKSAGFKTVPQSLHEVFLLKCNLRFMSYTSYDDVRSIIAVALASLYPLKDEQLYQAVCCGLPPNEELSWPKFKQRMDLLTDFLVQLSPTSGRTFFHSCFREWLIGQSTQVPTNGTLQSSSRFKVDIKVGYFLLAKVLSKQPPERLHKHATLELAHHVLKASMFKNTSKQTGVSASERNAHLMAESSHQLTEALTSIRNLFFPNMKVSKLLLRAGANPNVPTQVFSNATPLAVVAHTGCLELAELLLMFGADVNLPASNGMSALTFAAAAGRPHMVDLLLRYRPALNQEDHNGHTPLLHAISRGHADAAKLLLNCDLYRNEQYRTFAAQQALVASATTGDIKLMEYLLENDAFQCDVDGQEPSNGESPLTSAAAHGKSSACEFLVRKYKAKIEHRNKMGMTPLLCAVKHGEWDAADLLLNCGASLETRDLGGKSPLIMAACSGHLGVLELLLSRGANLNAADREGLTALSWAALQGQALCVRSLISRNANIAHIDSSGRTALDLAAFFGDPQIVDILLEAGSDITHVDATGMCALDRAIGCQNIAVVAKLLRRGAQILPTSWAMATGKTDVTLALLNKCLEDGNNMYKAYDWDSANDTYARALKHVGELSSSRADRMTAQSKLADLTAHLLLGYSRCLRKLDDLEGAEKTASRALELKPHWYEALYARARVLREESRLQAALCDVIEAEKTAPPHNMKEIKRLIERIKDEMRKGGTRHSRPPSASSEIIPVPQPRQRLNSNSSYHGNHGNHSRGSSPSPAVPGAELSRSYQPRYHGYSSSQHDSSHQLAPLCTGGQNRIGRGNSHESLTESMLSLAPYPPEPSPHVSRRGQNNASAGHRALPRTNPHCRPRAGDFNRSMSEETRGQVTNGRYPYEEDTRSLCGDVQQMAADAARSNYRRVTQHHMDPSRGSFVTDL